MRITPRKSAIFLVNTVVFVTFLLIYTHETERRISYSEITLISNDDNVNNNIGQNPKNSQVTRIKDINCIHTLPQNIFDYSSDVRIKIPTSLKYPPNVISCLYHRYVTSIQALCKQPRRFGELNSDGFLCMDDSVFDSGQCNILTYGNINPSFRKEVGKTLRCEFTVVKGDLAGYVKDGLENYAYVMNLTNKKEDDQIFTDLVQSTEITRIYQLSVTMYFKPDSTIAYKRRLRTLRKLHDLGFRIFFFSRPLGCPPFDEEEPQLLSCYTVHFVNSALRRQVWPKSPDVLIPQDAALKRMWRSDLTKLYDMYLPTLQYLCHENVRIGHIQDGGWNLCHDREFRPRKPCIVYSFGISDDWSFDEEMSRTYGCRVFSFDPSLGRENFQHSEQVWFYNFGLGGQDKILKVNETVSWDIKTLETIKRELNHSGKVIDVLKIDIEDSEWTTLPQMLSSGVLGNVRQLFLEFHWRGNRNKLIMIRQLYEQGFRIFWTHENPNCSLQDRERWVTICYEVYFVNTKLEGQ